MRTPHLAVTAAALAAMLLPVCDAQAPVSIADYGAVPWNNSYAAAVANGRAILKALTAANTGASGNSRAVVVPTATNYTVIPQGWITGLNNITLHLEGNLIAWTQNVTYWPIGADGNAVDLLHFVNSTDLTITTSAGTANRNGFGILDGDGFDWWWYVLLTTLDNRPNLIGFQSVANFKIENLRMYNSPQFHFYLTDVLNGDIGNIEIYVNVEVQQAMLRSQGMLTTGKSWSSHTPAERARLRAVRERVASHADPEAASTGLAALADWEALDLLPAGIPVFPLNTDGIDVAGRNIYIHDCNITNFDDAVCAKPLNANSGRVAGSCSRDVLAERIHIAFGVGATIGSVPPHVGVNCISNWTFNDITFTTPIKGLYLKPNPGTVGTGIISQITYSNVYGNNTIWTSIDANTQQQKQPGNGTDTGCSFFFPLFNTTCPLQPRVPIIDLRLDNVVFENALLSLNTIRCANATEGAGIAGYQPCSGWDWTDVTLTSISSWPLPETYYCHGIDQPTWTNVNPTPVCT